MKITSVHISRIRWRKQMDLLYAKWVLYRSLWYLKEQLSIYLLMRFGISHQKKKTY